MTGMEEDDWVGRLAAGLVGFTKTVEVRVIVTGPLAPAWGIPPEIEEEIEEGVTEGMEGEPTDEVEYGSSSGVGKDGLTEVAEGLTVVDPTELALERVTLFPSNSASLRERLEYSLPRK